MEKGQQKTTDNAQIVQLVCLRTIFLLPNVQVARPDFTTMLEIRQQELIVLPVCQGNIWTLSVNYLPQTAYPASLENIRYQAQDNRAAPFVFPVLRGNIHYQVPDKPTALFVFPVLRGNIQHQVPDKPAAPFAFPVLRGNIQHQVPDKPAAPFAKRAPLASIRPKRGKINATIVHQEKN
jgi:hypothetical protein